EDGDLRKFRRALETAMVEINGRDEDPRGVGDEVEAEAGVGGGLRRLALEGRDYGRGVGHDLVTLVAPDAGELFQDVAEARPTIELLLWEIGAAPEGKALGRQEHGERQAALLAQRMQRLHIE